MIKKFVIIFSISIFIIGFGTAIALTPNDSLPINKLDSLVMEDLSNSNFKNMDLSGIDFSGKNLSNSNFKNMDLSGIDFSGKNLSNSNFEESINFGS